MIFLLAFWFCEVRYLRLEKEAAARMFVHEFMSLVLFLSSRWIIHQPHVIRRLKSSAPERASCDAWEKGSFGGWEDVANQVS